MPTQWPAVFTRLQYLQLQFNDLANANVAEPSGLPTSWSSAQKRGFPALSILTLYPGNDYLCSVPTVEGGFLDVNRGECLGVGGAGGQRGLVGAVGGLQDAAGRLLALLRVWAPAAAAASAVPQPASQPGLTPDLPPCPRPRPQTPPTRLPTPTR